MNNILELQEKLKQIFTDDKLYNKLCKGAFETSKKIDIPHMVDGIFNAIKYVSKIN